MATNNYLRVSFRANDVTCERAVIFFDDRDEADTKRAFDEARALKKVPRDRIAAYRGECDWGREGVECSVGKHHVDGLVMMPERFLGLSLAVA